MNLRKILEKVIALMRGRTGDNWARKQIRGIAELRGKLILM